MVNEIQPVRRNIKWIATLRGVAILLIFACHYVNVFSQDLSFVAGRIGVVCFMMIAGYLASVSLKKRSVTGFLANRFLRVYPLYWVILTIYYLLLCLDGTELVFLEYLANLTLFEEFMGFRIMMLLTWMLPIMLLSFFLEAYLHDKTYKVCGFSCLLLCALSFVLAIVRHMTGIAFPVAVPLLMGVALLGFMAERYDVSKVMTIGILVTLAGTVLVAYPDLGLMYVIAYWGGIGMFFLFRRYGCSCNVLDRFGIVGYSFYLVSVIPDVLLKICLPIVYEEIGGASFTALYFVATLLLSVVVYRYVEQPMARKAKAIEARIE